MVESPMSERHGGEHASAPTATLGSEPVVLADGRHPVYLKTVDPDRQR
jgi:hypothetical protein